MTNKKTLIVLSAMFLLFSTGCAGKQVVQSPYRNSESGGFIEERIESLADKLVDTLRNRDFASSNLAIIEESAIGRQEVSQFGTFVIDRLKKRLTEKNFSIVDMKGVQWGNILKNRPIEIPENECGQKETPEIILLLNVKDYGQNSRIYVSVTAKRADSNRFVEGLIVEEQFRKTERIVGWLSDVEEVSLPFGTQENPFKSIDDAAEYLANAICCPYRAMVSGGVIGERKIDPEQVSIVVMAVNASTQKTGDFERLVTKKLKTSLIKTCNVKNAVDLSDYALLDKQLAFYEDEGTFKLDYMSGNRERFKPGSVLLIAETYFHEDAKADIMLRAVWLKKEAETVSGGMMRAGGEYLPGFAANAYVRYVSSNTGKVKPFVEKRNPDRRTYKEIIMPDDKGFD